MANENYVYKNPSPVGEDMYLISVDNKETPFLANGEIILLYSQKEKADEAVKGFCRLYGAGCVQCVKLDKPKIFLKKYASHGINSYIVDGSSQVYSIIKRFSPYPQKIIRKNKLLSVQPNNKKRIRKKTITIGGICRQLSKFSFFISVVSFVLLWIINDLSHGYFRSESILPVLVLSLSGIIVGVADFAQSVNNEARVAGMALSGIFIGLAVAIKCIAEL